MPITEVFADPVVLLAVFLSSLCQLLLVSGPYLWRAYRKQLLRFSGDAGSARSEDLHRDPAGAEPVPTVNYSTLTDETGHHIGHHLRLGNIQGAEALYRFWASLSPSMEVPTSRKSSSTFAKSIEEAQERTSMAAQSQVACAPPHSDVAPFHAAVWRAANDIFGSVQIAALERCMAREGYRFGSEASLEVALPVGVQLRAAQEIAEVRVRHLYTNCTEVEAADAVRQEQKDGYCLSLLATILRAARACGRFVQRDAAQIGDTYPAKSSNISDVSEDSSMGIPDDAEQQHAWSISFRLAKLACTHRYNHDAPDGHSLHELIEEAAALHAPSAAKAGYEARVPQADGSDSGVSKPA